MSLRSTYWTQLFTAQYFFNSGYSCGFDHFFSNQQCCQLTSTTLEFPCLRIFAPKVLSSEKKSSSVDLFLLKCLFYRLGKFLLVPFFDITWFFLSSLKLSFCSHRDLSSHFGGNHPKIILVALESQSDTRWVRSTLLSTCYPRFYHLGSVLQKFTDPSLRQIFVWRSNLAFKRKNILYRL